MNNSTRDLPFQNVHPKSISDEIQEIGIKKRSTENEITFTFYHVKHDNNK